MRIPLLLALLLALLLQVLFVGHVSAHSELVDSQPADGALLDRAPERVVATFSEELDSGLSGLRVFDAQGTQVDNGYGGVDLDDLDHLSLAVSLPPLTGGSYTVRWKAVSAEDGDGTEGAFSFTIAGSGAVVPEAVVPPADKSSGLTIGAITVGVLLLLALVVICARRHQKAPVDR